MFLIYLYQCGLRDLIYSAIFSLTFSSLDFDEIRYEFGITAQQFLCDVAPTA